MDIDICSQDPELENLFSNISGKKDESVVLFLRRSFRETCQRIAEPAKASYESSDLCFCSTSAPEGNAKSFSFELTEFNIVSNGLKLHCALWRSNANNEIDDENEEHKSVEKNSRKAPPCIVYTHTNTRSLADAVELQPLAMSTGCNVVAFDMPGAGKSDGILSGSCAAVMAHIDAIIEWAVLHLNTSEVILWARGMSTAAAIEYTSSSSSSIRPMNSYVKFVLLDTPYSSVKEVIDVVVQKHREKNSFALVAPLFRTCSFLFGREVTKRLGSDIYAVKPINYASSNMTPCLILSALNDDYIPSSHARQFAKKWSGPCFLKSFTGSHYSARPKEVVMLAYDYIRSFVSFPSCAVE